MLYHWLYPLADTIPGLNVVRYITFRTAAATLTALFISFIVGPWLIRATRARCASASRSARSARRTRRRPARRRWAAS